MSDPHRDIVAFFSKDWNGEIDVAQCHFVDKGTKGFCILLSGDYVIHDGRKLNMAWVDHGDDVVKLSPVDLNLNIN